MANIMEGGFLERCRLTAESPPESEGRPDGLAGTILFPLS